MEVTDVAGHGMHGAEEDVEPFCEPGGLAEAVLVVTRVLVQDASGAFGTHACQRLGWGRRADGFFRNLVPRSVWTGSKYRWNGRVGSPPVSLS